MVTVHTQIHPADDETTLHPLEVTAAAFAQARQGIHDRTPAGWVNTGLIIGPRA